MLFKSPEIKLSVVVCTFNRCELLRECLQSLAEQTAGPDEYEVLVIDNNCTDNTVAVVEMFSDGYPQFHYLRETNQGLSFARNRGWMEARGDFVAYIDDDAVAAPDWVEKVLAAFTQKSPKPAAVGGPILPRLKAVPPWWFSARLETRSWGEHSCFLQPPLAKFGFSGSNMALTKKLLSDYGGFNTTLGMCGENVLMGEEVDLFARIYEAHPLFWYDPAIKVEHLVACRQLSLRTRMYRCYQAGRSRRRFKDVNSTGFGLVNEAISLWCRARELLSERPFNFGYIFTSMLDRTANCIGYLTARRW